MNVASLSFLIFVAVAIPIFARLHSARAKRYGLLAANVVFLASFSATPYALFPILCFALFGYALLYIRRIIPGWPLWANVAVTLAVFAWLKQYKVLPHASLLTFSYTTVGLSYVLFRVLHLIVDVHNKDIPKPPKFADYFSYIFFFLSFLSGPIERWQDFEGRQQDIKKPNDIEARQALSRLATGYVKTLVIAPLLQLIFDQLHQIAPNELGADKFVHLPNFAQGILHNGHGQLIFGSAATYATVFALYAMYLYFNFSGYMDIVISVGRMFGFTIPENFNAPFLAGNLMDFWARWHMTLTQWFKVYVFNPLFKAVSTRFSSPAMAPWLVVPVFFVSFFLMGVWHGTTLLFVAYGLFWGLGVSLNQLYQIALRRKFGKQRYTALARNALYRIATRAGTFCFFSFSLTCFWMPSDEFQYIGTFLGLKGMVLIAAGIWASALIALSLLDRLFAWAHALEQGGDTLKSAPHFANFWTAVKFMIAIYYFVASGSHAPEFVYRAF